MTNLNIVFLMFLRSTHQTSVQDMTHIWYANSFVYLKIIEYDT